MHGLLENSKSSKVTIAKVRDVENNLCHSTNLSIVIKVLKAWRNHTIEISDY